MRQRLMLKGSLCTLVCKPQKSWERSVICLSSHSLSSSQKRNGRILALHKGVFAFLFNREYASTTGGVFVTRSTSLVSTIQRSVNVADGIDAGLQGGMVGSVLFRSRREPLINASVQVIRGGYKGKGGVIKEVNEDQVQLELRQTLRTVMISAHDLNGVYVMCFEDNLLLLIIVLFPVPRLENMCRWHNTAQFFQVEGQACRLR